MQIFDIGSLHWFVFNSMHWLSVPFTHVKELIEISRHLLFSAEFLHIAVDMVVHSRLLGFLHNVFIIALQNLLALAEIQKFWSIKIFLQIWVILSEQEFDGIMETQLCVASSLHDPSIILVQILFPSVEMHSVGSDETSVQIPCEFLQDLMGRFLHNWSEAYLHWLFVITWQV
jgi:hypothetical protein